MIADQRDPTIERLHVLDPLVFLRVDVGRVRRIAFGRVGHFRLGDRQRLHPQLVRDPAGQRAEFHLGEKGHQLVGIGVLHFEVVEGEVDGRFAVELDEPLRQFDLFAFLGQGLTPLRLLDLFRPVEQRFQIAVFVDEQRGGLDPDPRRARHIVDAVTCERLHVHDPFGSDAEFLNHAFAVDPLILHRVEHFDTVAHKLHQVFVRGQDGDPPPGFAPHAGQRRDDVVGLVAFHLLAGDVEGDGRFARERDLRAQIFGHLVPVRLVLVVHIVAERVAALVEHHRHMGRRVGAGVVLDIPLEHVAEPADRPDGQPVGLARQRRQRVVGAEDIGRAVDEVQMAPFAECHARLPLGRHS